MKYTVTVAGRIFEIEVTGEHVRVDGLEVDAALVAIPQTPLRRLVMGERARTFTALKDDGVWGITYKGERWTATVEDERTRQLRELTGVAAVSRTGGVIKAPMPGLVLRVEVEEGQAVDVGTRVVVLEAMKMENEIKTLTEGVVRSVHVRVGQVVEKGARLVEIGGRLDPDPNPG